MSGHIAGAPIRLGEPGYHVARRTLKPAHLRLLLGAYDMCKELGATDEQLAPLSAIIWISTTPLLPWELAKMQKFFDELKREYEARHSHS